MEDDDSPTTSFKLFVTAILHGHVPIVQYLLSIHPEENFRLQLIAQAFIEHPNMEIIKIVHAHQPNIVTMGFDYLRTFLTEACRGGQDNEAPADPLSSGLWG